MNAVTAIYVAQHLTREIAIIDAGGAVESDIDLAYLEQIGKASRIEEWTSIARIVSGKYKQLTND